METVWTRAERKQRPTLSREQIVRAAVAVADSEGLDAVSIRRIATELGARAMSLYTYIERKEDLFDLMIDEVAAETVPEGPLPAQWREATIAIARLEREAALRHPWLIGAIARRSQTSTLGPNMLRHLELSLAALDPLPATPTEKWQIIRAVSDYTSGAVLRESRERAGTAGGHDVAHLRAMTDSGAYPRLTALLGVDRRDSFEQGLRWLLNGISPEDAS
ncbi:TetR family transcriptional regulator [Virgisporangium aliadipatigenens]|uniref:TetR family transcriptional regulator n=1 Tax=Virgisporangium aliadipatigenens TaxID=741659 RepID=A0A8J4DVY2_9ACTN|nr:TetR/AcrR family transcriptional regulator C-terminal domain-containing protein [Virgisporangium aliadipatigenens]GIJ51941.1 TetR family transcriptional regulator [Virgisporangium aliadipatigenens]